MSGSKTTVHLSPQEGTPQKSLSPAASAAGARWCPPLRGPPQPPSRPGRVVYGKGCWRGGGRAWRTPRRPSWGPSRASGPPALARGTGTGSSDWGWPRTAHRAPPSGPPWAPRPCPRAWRAWAR